ncbi:C2H2 finger domain-containing protein [Stagonosporopsis vannaccii]|nr:C2H2 finger domain-containing protein [Stagonosporopsis vannaccii]
MSSNDHTYNYPYEHQSSAQHYASHQTIPPSNSSTKSSRQFNQAPSAAPNQSADYLPYSGTSSGASNTRYGAAQDSTWSTTKDNGSRAAEVLRNMSSTGYAATTVATSQSRFSATNAAGRSPQVQAQSSQASSRTSYDQPHSRPRSVNTNQAQASASRGLLSPETATEYPSQRAPHHSQQQTGVRTASPTQNQYGKSNPAAASRNATMAAAGSSHHYPDYNHRHFPDADASRFSHAVPPPTSYISRPPAPIFQPLASSLPEPYTGSSTTVDPIAVYDPWPEYQRRQAIRDAERAESNKDEENARKERERLETEERKQREAQEEAQGQQRTSPMTAPAETSGMSAVASELEAEIRSMMSKMREINGKDPQLLARIWEEERRAKAAPATKSPTIMMKSAPQPAIVPPTGAPTPPLANQGRKATPRDSFSTPAAKPATSVQTPSVRVPAATSVRTGGTTIWPADKKFELAKAAAHYLTTKNPDRILGLDQILELLDGNPSYVELCEQLEQMGFKLDRSIFAKSLLLAVPDVNSASRKQSGPAVAMKPPAPPAIMKHPAHLAVLKRPATITVASSPRYAPAAASPISRSLYPSLPDSDIMAAPSPIPVAEMTPIKPELKPPANKEEAARKRKLSDLVDLTQLEDDHDMGPPMKNFNANTYTLPYAYAMDVGMAPVSNFPIAGITAPISNAPTANTPLPAMDELVSRPTAELRHRAIVEPLDRKKALRRNTYNPATIARDVLLACGRHPSERQLNQHLDVLKAHLSQVTNESDLSTIKWDLVDPGDPTPEYFKDSVQALTEDVHNDAPEDEDKDEVAPRGSSLHAESARAQALPEATNPFIKQKRRGRPPRQTLLSTTTPSTLSRQKSSANMSASVPRPPSAGVGYSAFREYGPDGSPLPKKKGRPVGWRKAIHGSAAAQQRPAVNRHTDKYEPQKSSTLRNGGTGPEPIRIDSRSPSVVNHRSQYHSFKCRWQNCKAELHNLVTLKLHVFKVHKENLNNTLECLWDDCDTQVTSHDPMSNMTLARRVPHAFEGENAWREHIQQNHFDPLAWEQGDGPTAGLSDAQDPEAYLSDAQGRRVTPRITARSIDYEDITLSPQLVASTSRGRGRPLKNGQEQEARDIQDRLVAQKRRMGGPGMDRGGATLVNDKRRRGLVSSDGTEEEYVNAED